LGSEPFVFGFGFMKVLVDGYNIGLSRGTGVATYGRNLAASLINLNHEVGILHGRPACRSKESVSREVAFFDGEKISTGLKGLLQRVFDVRALFVANSVDEILVTGAVITDALKSRFPSSCSIYNSADLYRRAISMFRIFGKMTRVSAPPGVDVVHWTYPIPVVMEGVKNIYTLHDLVPIRLPYTTLDRKGSYFRLCKKIAETADAILTVSESSKADIVNLLRADASSVFNTYQSVDRRPTDAQARERAEAVVCGIFGLRPGHYFLFYGNIEPKKNVGRLIDAYLTSGAKRPLIIVGSKAWKWENELRLLDSLDEKVGLKSRVVRFDYLPEEMLVSLIRCARATLFPSLYEGFGLPVLESMSLGTPVLSSNVSSIPEVAGDAALLVNPYNVNEIAAGIASLDYDDSLCSVLATKGFIQSNRFSSVEFERRLENVYRSL
jgi:glycosyltransferase involved in cell wall biosynthesis